MLHKDVILSFHLDTVTFFFTNFFFFFFYIRYLIILYIYFLYVTPVPLTTHTKYIYRFLFREKRSL